MNFWIVKLGISQLTETEQRIFNNEVSNYLNKKVQINLNFQKKNTHLISYSVHPTKNYHSVSNDLFGFSGLLVGHSDLSIDLRNAGKISEKLVNIGDITDLANGQFSLYQTCNGSFECIVDRLGSYKVFYFTHNEHVYVTNFTRVISELKPSKPNIEFYINFIATGGTYGNYTDDQEVNTLPESGRLKWSAHEGLIIDQYASMNDLYEPEGAYEELLERAALSMKNSAKYLTKYHEVALSLSGGFDSRLVLEMYADSSNRNIQTFTFPDNALDEKLAKKVAKSYGFSHVVLNPSSMPDLTEMTQFSESNLAPYRNYDNVVGYIFDESYRSHFTDSNYVILNGNGGDIDDYGIKKFKNLDQISEFDAIDSLLQKIVNKEILTDAGYKQIYEHLKKYYLSKYSPLLKGKGNHHKLRLLYFIFERFGNYQGYKFFINYFKEDLYLPFSNPDFVRVSMSPLRQELMRSEPESLHRHLSTIFMNGRKRAIPFSSSEHWDIGTLHRYNKRIGHYLHQKFLKRFDKPAIKYSSKIRSEFFDQNLKYYKEVIHNSTDSSIWSFIDREHVQSLLNDENFKYYKGGELLSKIIPLLNSGRLDNFKI